MRRFAVVYEARADFITATEIADRVILVEVDWLDEAQLPDRRQWVDEERPGAPLTWKSIPRRARLAGIRVHGHFNGEPGLPDASAARRAIVYILRIVNDVDGVFLIRDQDDQPRRLAGLRQAREGSASTFAIVLGLAICERESWLICGFEPADDEERKRLKAERKKLGFDPRLRSHDLTAVKDDGAKKSPKRVLQSLTAGDQQRQRDCWHSTDLGVLQERGKGNGLSSYLDEIRQHIVPLLTGQR
jgi:hypothetical protein